MTKIELQKILEDHKLWLSNKGGKRADFSDADLRYANLRDANLFRANLRHADLSYADLSYADLRHANLSYANLIRANLRDADLFRANLSYADLSYADFSDADLRHANLSGANLSDVQEIKVAACHWSGHGECGRLINAAKIGEEIIFFCGCFKGNEHELRDYIAKGDQAYFASRTKALEFLLSCF